VRQAWLELVGAVLKPARPHLERCLRERELHVARERHSCARQARALADCRARIERARAAAFAAGDGIVTWEMTCLEREWRALSRSDSDGKLMDLWARVAPAAWLDRKLWRDSDPAVQLDAAIALAADPEGVDAAESAARSLRVVLAAWGTPVGARIRWRLVERDADATSVLLAEPLRAASGELAARGAHSIVFGRARRLELEVRGALGARFPARPLLAQGVSHAAFVAGVFRAASLTGRPDPVVPLQKLWATGYALSAIDSSGVTLEIPPLSTVELSSTPLGSA
jgi:hypothetical protein